jgi:PhnB protein
MASAPITPYLAYEDADAAIDWLTKAFGFSETLRSTGEDGKVNHAELELEGGSIMLGAPGGDYQGPKRSGGAKHIFVHAYVEDVDAHYERAKAAGANILAAPADQEYGDRRYQVEDLDGHVWFFAQRIRDVDPAEWGATTAARERERAHSA